MPIGEYGSADSYTFGYEPPKTGKYLVEVDEVSLVPKKNKEGEFNLLVTANVLESDSGSVAEAGKGLRQYIPLGTDRTGERIWEMCDIHGIGGLLEANFAGMEITDDKVIQQIQLSLPGKKAYWKVNTVKDETTGFTNANVTEISRLGGKEKASGKSAPASSDAGDAAGW